VTTASTLAAAGRRRQGRRVIADADQVEEHVSSLKKEKSETDPTHARQNENEKKKIRKKNMCDPSPPAWAAELAVVAPPSADIVLTCDAGVEAHVCRVGGIVRRLFVPGADGARADVVLGYDETLPYVVSVCVWDCARARVCVWCGAGAWAEAWAP
jgi:hypothetical protein